MHHERRVLITGAAGFIGAWVSRRLTESGARVIATDYKTGRENGSSIVQCDLDVEGDTAKLATLGRFDTIVHLAWPLPRLEDTSLLEPEVLAPSNQVVRLLELARTQGAAFVFASTAMVYGRNRTPFQESMGLAPSTPYAYAKAVSELAVLYYHSRYGVPYTIVRPSVIYGPGQRGRMFVPSLVAALVRGDEFPMTNGEQRRDFLHIDDLADLFVKAVEKRECAAIVNAGSGVGVPLCEVATFVQDMTFSRGRALFGAVAHREVELWDYSLDIERARRIFDWSPKTSLRNGLAETIAAELTRSAFTTNQGNLEGSNDILLDAHQAKGGLPPIAG
ncbi:MAG: NAD(P)-dependent oxidoreductase [Polyangiaceae bacterium]